MAKISTYALLLQLQVLLRVLFPFFPARDGGHAHLRNKVLVGIQASQKVSASPGCFPVNAQMSALREEYHVVHSVSARKQRRVGHGVLGSVGNRPTSESCHLLKTSFCVEIG